MKYTTEIYEAIAKRRPSLTQLEIDARSAATIMAWVKEINLELYMRVFRNK